MNNENTSILITLIKAHDDKGIEDFYAQPTQDIGQSFLWKFYAQPLCSALFKLNEQSDYSTIHDLLKTFERLKFLGKDELLCTCIFYDLGHEAQSYMDEGVFISASRLSNFYTHLKPTHNLSQALYKDLSQTVSLLHANEQRYDLREHLLARTEKMKNALNTKLSHGSEKIKRSKI